VEVKLTYSCKDAAVVHVVLELRLVSIIEGPKHVVHEFLHYSGAVSRSKRHYSGRIKPVCSFECQNVLQLFFDCDIIVTFAQVKLAEEDCSNHVFKYHGDSRRGADIFNYDCIDLSVVE